MNRRSAARISTSSPARPQPGQGQGGVGTGADDQAQLWRQVVDEERHPGGDVDAVGEVVVVEDQGDLAGVHAQLVDHPGEHGLHRRLPGLEQGERGGAGARDGSVEGQEHVGPERRGLPVTLVEGHPRDGFAVVRPAAQSASQPASRVVFPNPAGAETRVIGASDAALQQVGQPRPRHDLAARPGQEQLGLHQRVGHRALPSWASDSARA